MSILHKQTSAIHLAISSLEEIRRKNFAVAHGAFSQGFTTDVINSDGITGHGFAWVKEGEAKWQEYTKAIQEMRDMLEILDDTDEILETDLPLFQGIEET